MNLMMPHETVICLLNWYLKELNISNIADFLAKMPTFGNGGTDKSKPLFIKA